jgi:Flp pilus assembly protein CpaB
MRGRTLILVGLIVLMVAVAAGVLLMRGRAPEPAPVTEGTPGPTPLPQDMEEILVAAQGTIPRGTLITEESGAVTTAIWPKDSVPEGTLTEVEEVYGRYTRVDVLRGMPIIDSILTEKPGELGAIGSDVAVQIPSGKVAYALPVARYSSVAWALQPGDYVDVLISLLIVELDEEFQTILPNQAQCISPSEDPACAALSGVVGRLEGLPNNWVVNRTPSEVQRPQLVTQVAVQNAMVLNVGDWQEKREEPPVEEETTGEEEAPPVESVRGDVEPVTLVVTPQDAIALKYALEIGADIDLVLRAVGDTASISTETVTLQYLFSRFNIEQPPKLPYGVEPRLKSLSGTASEAEGSPEGGEPRE